MSENLPAPENLLDAERIQMIKNFRNELTGFMLNYQFGIDEILTKINILKTEFSQLHEYAPIEHVSSRLKTPESIVKKVIRKGNELSLAAIKDTVFDIAGIRIVCSFLKDAYAIADMLTNQKDVTVIEVKDYIANPKPNGYKSLHLILQVPVFLSNSVEKVNVEVQIRTIAMDFWASLEHKIYYKFEQEVPQSILDELSEAAEIASALDVKMERIHGEVKALKPPVETTETGEVKLPTAITFKEIFGRDFSA